ncbi:TRAP transporter small permease [Arenibaculum sp.]|uniref:TRAP transporter small permease n=1 Tax=Arenibaculum sp. TaxID=2865862 RepID=UPI002E0FD12F|nr:TRAP transporter small permease [Arenibaculum sp.]
MQDGPGKGVMARVARVLSAVSTVALWAAGAGLVLMTAVVAWQVYGRYVLNRSPSWTEPGAVMLMSWFILLGAAAGVRENNHLGFDVLVYLLPRGAKGVLRTISDLVVLAFGAGMVWYGGQLAALTWGSTLPSLGISGAFDYLPVVVGGVLIALFALERIALRLGGAPVDQELDEAPAAGEREEAAGAAQARG